MAVSPCRKPSENLCEPSVCLLGNSTCRLTVLYNGVANRVQLLSLPISISNIVHQTTICPSVLPRRYQRAMTSNFTGYERLIHPRTSHAVHQDHRQSIYGDQPPREHWIRGDFLASEQPAHFTNPLRALWRPRATLDQRVHRGPT